MKKRVLPIDRHHVPQPLSYLLMLVT